MLRVPFLFLDLCGFVLARESAFAHSRTRNCQARTCAPSKTTPQLVSASSSAGESRFLKYLPRISLSQRPILFSFCAGQAWPGGWGAEQERGANKHCQYMYVPHMQITHNSNTHTHTPPERLTVQAAVFQELRQIHLKFPVNHRLCFVHLPLFLYQHGTIIIMLRVSILRFAYSACHLFLCVHCACCLELGRCLRKGFGLKFRVSACFLKLGRLPQKIFRVKSLGIGVSGCCLDMGAASGRKAHCLLLEQVPWERGSVFACPPSCGCVKSCLCVKRPLCIDSRTL